MKSLFTALALVALGCSPRSNDTANTTASAADTGIDPELAQEIAKIKAVDNHAHPVRPTPPGQTPDIEFDALPVDNLEPQSDPVRQRPKAPIVVAAGLQLFHGDKNAAIRAHGMDYATWILDQL